MKIEDIAKLVKEFTISNKGDHNVTIKAEELKMGEERASKCLVARVISHKVVNKETFRTHVPRILQLTKKVEVDFVGKNTFIMEFASLMDRRRVLLEGPWSCFQDLIVIKEPRGMDEPRSLCFDEVAFWVQCHNVPIAFSQIGIMKKIGAQIGEVEEVDHGESSSLMGRFVRMRVRINIRKPLKQFLCVGVEDGEEVIIILSYERLSEFCYRCGVLGHSFRTYGEPAEENTVMRYGVWMRAQTVGSKGRSRSPPVKTPNSQSVGSEGTSRQLQLVGVKVKDIQSSLLHVVFLIRRWRGWL
ncbi:uncharacterized protein [Henckelia pumila]|uniref:uncharacterized protein n=1 Tax=Henckelia pumila TaxID=405737 RepID=UPI003C6E914D